MELASKIMSDITIYMKYAKWLPDEWRKETWDEIVDRNMKMHLDKIETHGHGEGTHFYNEVVRVYNDYVRTFKILPSMRSMQYAGKAIEVSPNSIYNCAYMPIDAVDCFHEAMFLLMNGTGLGYSVQKHHVRMMPEITQPNKDRTRKIVVQDSIIGWAEAVKDLFRSYFGELTQRPRFIYDDIRPKGTRLKTRGGKAPGPAPLRECLVKVEGILQQKENGSQLTSIECHDIMCHLADAVTAGGNRRAALISLFSATDQHMMNAKSGKFYIDNPQRFRANNSAVLLRHRVKKPFFDGIWDRIQEGGSGEPGIYLTNDKDWGTNPCCEIALRPYQFCNLTEINSSTVVDQEDLNNRVNAATILGTLQASYTDFHYLRDIWRTTTERDALLGVSMTGLASNKVTNLDITGTVYAAKQYNKEWAEMLGINSAARITCVKPSGTASMVCGSSSGIHAWHDSYYIRRIRVGREESICGYLTDNHPELIVDDEHNPDGRIIEIPQKAPRNALTKEQEDTFMFLERVKNTTVRWVNPGHNGGQNTHNVSATVYINHDEWDEVGEWMWLNRHFYNGLACFPNDESVYVQAPFESCSKTKYEEMMKSLTKVDLTQIVEYDDDTNFGQDPACGGGMCEI
jgi:ribonucleoside-triphosphate reductase